MNIYIEAGSLKEKFTSKWILDRINQHPIADVIEVKHGKNISDSGFLCNICSFGDFGGFHGYEPNYCPNCGARLDERREDDEAVNTKN